MVWNVRVGVRLAAAICAVALGVLVTAGSASALVPAWSVHMVAVPSSLPPGGEGKIVVEAVNVGDAPALGGVSPIALSDSLPAGLTATNVSGEVQNSSEELEESEVGCELAAVRCIYNAGVSPFGLLRMIISVRVASGLAGRLVDKAGVVGGGAVGAVVHEDVRVSATQAGYGVEKLQLVPLNENGTLDTQAGSHPFELTTTLALNTKTVEGKEEVEAPAMAKDLRFSLPAGVIGNPQVVPQCTMLEFSTLTSNETDECPGETVVGVASVVFKNGPEGRFVWPAPIFNLVPAYGEPARFGFEIFHVPVILDTSVRTGGDYGVVVSVNDIQQVFTYIGSQVTFWGVPSDPAHNAQRGNFCVGPFRGPVSGCVAPTQQPRLTPFLTLPTSCSGPAGMRTTVTADSWSAPGVFQEGESTPLQGTGGEPLGLDGCNRLQFDPSIGVAPDGPAASTPTGLTVGVHVPQEAALNPTGLEPSEVKNTTVVLPEGVQISPAGAGGLTSCSLAQIGLEVDGPPSCPEASKIGTAEIKTPLLSEPLVGAVYLAAQDANPFGSLVALYIVVENPIVGVVVKLAGKVSLDPVTGRLVTTFENTPQLPFEDLKLHFFGSARAPLSTPARCGLYTTDASFTGWSEAPAEPSSTFQITSGPNGAPCPGASLPFSPSLTGGTTSIQAGGFSPFTMTVTREDGQQNINSIQLHMPPGLSGLLTGVELCSEANANAGTCSQNSLIGETTVSVGLGNDPFSVTGGKVYITGPYKGAPFGISVVVPAKAGPYDLGQVVVRGTIQVDPITSALTVTTDTSGPYAIPHILDGIPLEIKHVNFITTRPGFTFNPTNCDSMSVTGNVQSVEGSSSPVSVPFQVTNCAVLGFKPGFNVSTSGHTSRALGASLHVRLAYPKAPFGTQANIQKVKVDLPKQLPSRLTTLQKSCTEAVFAANPAACPAASRIGTAKATTPLIPVPLEGPVYFVSHGGAKFPELIIVLSGYGVTVQLHSETFIDKAGITSSTFRLIPDVPVGTFELTLPQGPDSALAANTNLCKVKGGLHMPTVFTAQNGLVIHQSTPITVTGCTKAKRKTKHKTGKAKKQ